MLNTCCFDATGPNHSGLVGWDWASNNTKEMLLERGFRIDERNIMENAKDWRSMGILPDVVLEDMECKVWCCV